MNKAKYIINAGLLLSILTLVGCSNYLDVKPANERAIKSFKDVKQAYSGYMINYVNLFQKPAHGTGTKTFTDDMIMLFEAYSDNIDFENGISIYLSPLNTSVRFEKEKYYADRFLYNNFSAPANFWNGYYTGIGFINTLVDVLHEVDGGTEDEREQLEGEMLMHRAYFLFKLLQHFAPYDDAKNGIPVYLHTGNEVVDIPMPRKSHAEVYEIILNDLSKVGEYLSRTSPKETFNVMYNNRFYNNLLAQIYWFKAESPAGESNDYHEAQVAAEIAIQGTSGAIATTSADFKKMLAGDLSDYPTIYQMSTNNWAPLQPIYGGPYGAQPRGMRLSQDLMDMFSKDDIRYEVILNSDGTIDTNEWPDGDRMGGKRGYYHLFQPEEAYLILAEAYYRQGNEGEAISVLNEFKSFRNSGDATGLSGNDLLQEIINERRLEFVGSIDHRWLDLKRYGNKTIERSFNFFGKDWDVTIEGNGYQYALPIPFSELEVNPHLFQNPGWRVQGWN